MDPVRQAIIDAARRSGIPPAVALAFAERESSFNPAARSSKTIQGLFQMRGDHRSRYGVGDSLDPGAQTEGWGRFAHDLRKEMAAALGRDPTWTETYLGHHFGGGRASRMLGMDPSTPVSAVFQPHELEINPHIVKEGTVGKLLSSTSENMSRRIARHGGEEPQDLPDFASYGEPADAPDFSAFGELVDAPQKTAEVPKGAHGVGTALPAIEKVVESGNMPDLQFDKFRQSTNVEDRRNDPKPTYRGEVGEGLIDFARHSLTPGALLGAVQQVAGMAGKRFGPYDDDIDASVKRDREKAAIEPVLKELEARTGWFNEIERQRRELQRTTEESGPMPPLRHINEFDRVAGAWSALPVN